MGYTARDAAILSPFPSLPFLSPFPPSPLEAPECS